MALRPNLAAGLPLSFEGLEMSLMISSQNWLLTKNYVTFRPWSKKEKEKLEGFAGVCTKRIV